MSGMYDLAVIGGGPAGTSAAITAARLGFRVLLLEAGKFPRHKVCGEFVSGEAISTLRTILGSASLLEDSPRVSKARIFVDSHAADLVITPPALSLSRYQLDAALWEKALESGARACEKTSVKEIHHKNDAFLILTETGQSRARAVIDASGRWSRLRRLRPVVDDNNWIGLKGHFYEAEPSNSCDLYFFPGGYCGIQPLKEGRVNAAAMVRPAIARTLSEVFAQNPELETRSRGWQAASEPVSTAPLFFAAPRTVDREIALAGDAAAFIDPFAGDGISIALHSGDLAAISLSAYLRGETSLTSALESYDRQYRQLIAPALKNASRLRRLLRLPKPLQLTAVALLNFPFIARAAVQQTRVRRAS